MNQFNHSTQPSHPECILSECAITPRRSLTCSSIKSEIIEIPTHLVRICAISYYEPPLLPYPSYLLFLLDLVIIRSFKSVSILLIKWKVVALVVLVLYLCARSCDYTFCIYLFICAHNYRDILYGLMMMVMCLVISQKNS